ncbi:MAG: hypothetical protein JWN49_437 [Parcubacteria group bacterium]|nr:hypothetical protein [Parcubacteria group bacterium]
MTIGRINGETEHCGHCGRDVKLGVACDEVGATDCVNNQGGESHRHGDRIDVAYDEERGS